MKNWQTIIILCWLQCLALTQKAILLSSSLGYYNIRQVNNVVKIYQHLRTNGFSDQDILLLIGEHQACCQKNHNFPYLSFYDGDYTNIYKNIEVDYYQSSIFLESVSNVLMGVYSPFTLNKRKLKLDNEPLFVYVTGHGGDHYFKIRQREAIVNEQFNIIFHTLLAKKEAQKVLVFSDSCSAITPFQQVKQANFAALASSSLGQKSLSHGTDIVLNQPKSDDFTFYLDELLMKDRWDELTLSAVKKYMNKERLKVNSKLITNGISPNEKLKNFIKKQQKIEKISLSRINKSIFADL